MLDMYRIHFICLISTVLLIPAACKDGSQQKPKSGQNDGREDNRVFMFVNDSGVNFRESPNATSKALRILNRGEKLEILEVNKTSVFIGGKSGKWVRATSDTGQGWVFDYFLSHSPPLAVRTYDKPEAEFYGRLVEGVGVEGIALRYKSGEMVTIPQEHGCGSRGDSCTKDFTLPVYFEFSGNQLQIQAGYTKWNFDILKIEKLREKQFKVTVSKNITELGDDHGSELIISIEPSGRLGVMFEYNKKRMQWNWESS